LSEAVRRALCSAICWRAKAWRLEKHQDFFRDFRGDTVHPSTLEVIYELGLLQEFLRLPHQELTKLGAVFGNYPLTVAEFRHVPTHCKFVALMP